MNSEPKSSTQLVLAGILWVVFFVQLVRAYRNHKLGDPAARRIWIIFFLGCVLFSLGGQNGDLYVFIEGRNVPLGIYAKLVTQITGFYLYYTVLQSVYPSRLNKTALTLLAPIALVIGTWLFITAYWGQQIRSEEARYMMVAFRDLVIAIYIIAALLPTTVFMLKQEQVAAMRVKHRAALLFFSSLLVSNLSNIVALAVALTIPQQAQRIVDAFTPFTYICFLLFIVMFVPHRWLSITFFPERIYTLYRLRRLESQIMRLMPASTQTSVTWRTWFSPDELELAIYQTTISILDRYPLIQSDQYGRQLAKSVARLVPQNNEYTDLVKSLATLA